MKAKIPYYIKKVFFNQVWELPNKQRKIYLTFDDGPVPEVTSWVLNVLKKHNIKATFFCIGGNIQKNPDIFTQVIAEGHQVANHSFNHLNGWKTKTKTYVENVLQAEDIILKKTQNSARLFRPPYGKIKLKQSYELRKLGFKIIMWNVLSKDYDTSLLPEQCISNVMLNVRSGSIINFHDSIKASGNLYKSLPSVIEELIKEGYVFDVLN